MTQWQSNRVLSMGQWQFEYSIRFFFFMAVSEFRHDTAVSIAFFAAAACLAHKKSIDANNKPLVFCPLLPFVTMIPLLFYSVLFLLVFVDVFRTDAAAWPDESAFGIAFGASCFAAVAALVGTVLALLLLRLMRFLCSSCCSLLFSALTLTIRLFCHLLQTFVGACGCRIDWLLVLAVLYVALLVQLVLQLRSWQLLRQKSMSIAAGVMSMVSVVSPVIVKASASPERTFGKLLAPFSVFSVLLQCQRLGCAVFSP